MYNGVLTQPIAVRPFQTVQLPQVRPSSKVRFGADVKEALPDMREAWCIPEVRQSMERVFLEDLFRHTPELGQQFVAKITTLCQQDLSNEARFQQLRQYYVSIAEQLHLKRSFSDHTTERVARRVRQLKEVLTQACPGLQPKSLLDVGSGDGLITAGLGQVLAIEKSQVIGLDIVPPDKPLDTMRSVQYDGKTFPFDSNSMDSASIISVLHHVAHFPQLVAETYRVLKPGGVAIIRDFNADTRPLKLFNHIMDLFYYRVFADLPDVPNPGCFFSESDWMATFRKAGFVPVRSFHMEPLDINPYNPFIVVLQKPQAPTTQS